MLTVNSQRAKAAKKAVEENDTTEGEIAAERAQSVETVIDKYLAEKAVAKRRRKGNEAGERVSAADREVIEKAAVEKYLAKKAAEEKAAKEKEAADRAAAASLIERYLTEKAVEGKTSTEKLEILSKASTASETTSTKGAVPSQPRSSR